MRLSWPELHPRICPICMTEVEGFLPFSAIRSANRARANARCPGCGSLERHRLVWLYFRDETDLLARSKPLKMLHVAAEPILKRLLRAEPMIDYVSADLHPAEDDIRMDLTEIHLEDETFDVIYCSHVLEHIPEDRLAKRELARVLRSGGWGIIQVPVIRDVTDEDTRVTDPAERERRFGQSDHVRTYGDYAYRLREAGFDVRVDSYAKRLGPETADRYGLMLNEDIYFCTKRDYPRPQG